VTGWGQQPVGIWLREPNVVYILAGQSNAAGVSPPAFLPPELAVPYPPCGLAAQIGCGIYPALCTWHDDVYRDLQARPTQYGVEITMGRDLYAVNRPRIYIVQHGTGGAALADEWVPYDPGPGTARLWTRLFDDFLPAMLAQTPRPTIGAFIWIQGEADADNAAWAAAYQANWDAFANAVRTELGDIPIIDVLLHVACIKPHTAVVRAAKTAVAGTYSWIHLVNVDDLVLADGLHFNGVGYRTLGSRLASTILAL